MIKKLLIIFIFGITILHGRNISIAKNIFSKELHHIKTDETLFKVPIYPGNIVNHEDIKNIINSLLSTENFNNVKIKKEKDSLIVKVIEKPIISNISYIYNKSIKEQELKKHLDLHEIKVGTVLNYTKIEGIKKSLQDLYSEIGKYNTVVKIEIIPSSTNKVELKIIFSEGSFTKIKQIKVNGNSFFPYKKIVSHFYSYEKSNYWNIINNKKYCKKKFNDDVKKLRDFYVNQGYANFNIESTDIVFSKDKKNVYITLNIYEGKKYELSDVKIHGEISIEYFNRIKKITEILIGKLYNNGAIEKANNEIKQVFSCDGYIYPEISKKLDIDDKNNTIILSFDIKIGKRFYVRHILFKGNNITKEYVLKREIENIENNWFNEKIIEKGKNNLIKLGYFENVKILIEHVPKTTDQVDIIYNIEEKSTGNLNGSLGFGLENGLNFQFDVNQSNLLGTGTFIGFNGKKNESQTYGEFSIKKPYFSEKNINFGLNFFYNDFNSENTRSLDYDLRSYGIGSSLKYPINKPKNLFNCGIDYVHNDLTNIKPKISIWKYLNSVNIPSSTTYCKKSKSKRKIFSSKDLFFSIGIDFNSFDDIHFPKSGEHITFSNKITTPGMDNSYYKLIFNTNSYIPLYKCNNWIIMGRNQIGYVKGIGNKEIPFYDTFYFGEHNNIRGFRANTIGPQSKHYECTNKEEMPCKNCSITTTTSSSGGNAMIINNYELIIPIPYLNKKFSKLIRASFFIDTGAIWNTKEKIDNFSHSIISNCKKLLNIRSSTGISLKWVSPFGPISFSYTWPIKKYKGDVIEQFQFNIGKKW